MKTCKRGHQREDHFNRCDECRRLRTKEWNSKNKDKGLASRREWLKENKPNVDAYKKQWVAENKEKVLEASKRWYKKNPDKVRDRQLQNEYGITLEKYNEMFLTQGGKCAICEIHQQELGKTLHVDHCHTTGKVRGLLCNHCNYRLSVLENPDFMNKATQYLTKYNIGDSSAVLP